MGLTEIKKELKKLDKTKLVEFVSELYKTQKSVKEYLDFYFNPDEKALFEKYKTQVIEAFYPKRGFGLNLKKGKKAISDFKKLGVTSKYLADLMLCYVEAGVEFTNDYGDIDENFYVSIERMYVQTLTLMRKEDLLDYFLERNRKVAYDTSDIGWGFYDYMVAAFIDYYPDELEEIDEDDMNQNRAKEAKIIRLKNI
jgi:hypothetical protein